MGPEDMELMLELLERWYSKREEVEQLLCTHFGLEDIEEIWRYRRAPQDSIPPWRLILVGGRIDLSLPNNTDGICYHLDAELPDAFEMRDFLIKQYNAGLLTKKWWRPLLQDQDRFERTFERFMLNRSEC